MEFIGHDNTKTRIKIAVDSATKRNTALPHILLSGAAGCGKTTTARWLASIGNFEYLPASPLELKNKRSVYALLEKLNTTGYNKKGDRVGTIKPTILFFDEVHQMPIIGQEILGLAMERFILEADMPNKLIWLPYFTIVGATTDDGRLTKPFRDRFKMKFIFEPYIDKDMKEVIIYHVNKNDLLITMDAINCLIERSRGVPRIMVNYLESIRDMMLSKNAEVITEDLVIHTFNEIGVDDTGLTNVEIKILKSLMDAPCPIGLENLSIVTNESNKTIAQTIEPFLIRRELIVRTGKGRTITDKGRQYLEERGHVSTKDLNKELIDAFYARG